MAKGYQVNRDRQELVNSFGKTLGKRATFHCEWCDGTDDLRVWDYRPDTEPTEKTLALLCASCRGLAVGKMVDENRLHSIRNALWSDIPAVAEGAARVLARCREPWVREAIEESLIDDRVKRELLGLVMDEERIEVIAYAGYRGEESPRTLLRHGTRIEVIKILDQWTEEAAETGAIQRCFKVKGSDFRTHVVCYDEGTMAWLYRTS